MNKQYCVFSTFASTKAGSVVLTGSEDGSIFAYSLNTKQVRYTAACAAHGRCC